MKMFNFLKRDRSGRNLTVLYASTNPRQDIVDQIVSRDDCRLREAFSTEGVLRDADAHLIVVGEMFSVGSISVDQTLATLEDSGRAIVPEDDFFEDPDRWVTQARQATLRDIRFFPARRMFMASGTGGVGQTFLAYSVAKHFSQTTGMKTAVIEMGLQATFCEASISSRAPDFYDCVTSDVKPFTWEDVTVMPSLRDKAMALDEKRVNDAWGKISRDHTLVVVDGNIDHPLWSMLSKNGRSGDHYIIISDTRDTSILTAERMKGKLSGVNPTYLLNKTEGITDTVGLANRPDVVIQMMNKPHIGTSKVADPILAQIYPNWE